MSGPRVAPLWRDREVSASPGARGIMKVQITAVWMGLTAATVAGQQSSQREPSTAAGSTVSRPESTVSRPESSTVSRPESSTVSGPESTREATRQPSEPAPLQLPPIARPDPAQAAPPQPNAPPQCPGNSSTVAAGSASSSFPGVSASQLPRAGVSADAFVRPGVSAAQLAVLQPGARSSPCAPPRDVILYPETRTPARRMPPPGGNEP